MTDFINDQDPVDDVLGLEKMNYTRFKTAYTIRRTTQAPVKFDDYSKLQLPNGAVLHSLNGFDTLNPPADGLPDAAIPLVINEKLPIYLKVHTQLAGPESLPFGINDNYTYRPAALMPAITHFFQHHRKYHRILSDRTLGTMAGVLTWVDYSPLNEVRVGGTLGAYRKFDLLFRTILDNVVRIGAGKHHYILLPQSSTVFSKALLQRSFRELTTSTLNSFTHDPSIFPILHLLGYVYGRTREIPVTPYKEDVRILGKEAKIFSEVKSTSLLERLDPSILESINFVLVKDNKAVIYNLADINTFADDASFFTKFYRHVMNLRLTESTLPSHIDPDSDQFDTLIDNVSGNKVIDDESDVILTKDTKVENKTQEDKVLSAPVETPEEKIAPIHITDSLVVPKASTSSFEEKIRTEAIKHSSHRDVSEPKIVQKRATLLENHLNVSINGKTLSELIHNPPPEVIQPKKMAFIKSAPEASYQQSSLIAMDRAYQVHAYHHEMAKVVGSLAKHGLFATKLEEDKTHTEMDKTSTYKVHLQDLDGKSHHVKFTVPDVDHNGLMKLSGIEYRLTRQIANIPICKVSPTRVNLSSYFNKIRVERVPSKRHSYEQVIFNLITDLRTKGLVKATMGAAPLPTVQVPYDYTAIGRQFTEISFDGFTFHFSGDGASLTTLNFENQDRLPILSQKYGLYVGEGPEGSLLFWDKGNQLHQINRRDEQVASWKSFNHLLEDRLGQDAIVNKTVSEWTQSEIINQTIPLVFILGYKFGLKTLLEMIKLDYRFYPSGTRPEINTMDISVKFSDGTLVFNRYPLVKSLIASGLNWVKLNDISFRDLSIPETYGQVFLKKDMSVGVLKGLSGFFDFFVDPITETVLEKMHEPTTFHELLLRANVMLSDYVAIESSSIALHRFRGYERFNGIIYNEVYRGLAQHRNNPSTKKAFSINPEAVFQKIVQDATVTTNEVINPVQEIKQRANFTFTGSGGRTPNSITPKDRIYPKDGLGVISESVPDSGKVGITAYLSASPNIDDIHGIPKPHETDVLEANQILSIGSMLMPSSTTDDGKRNNYLSIQLSHYVPNVEEGETMAVRTGYDEVLPHLTSETFATAAEEDGIVESIDEQQKVVKVRYNDRPTKVLRTLKLPYLDTLINQYRDQNKSFGFLIPEGEIADFPMGGIFGLTKTTNGKVVDRLRCESIDTIPDKEVARKQNTLIQDFIRGRYKALYYIRLQPILTKTPGLTKTYSYQPEYGLVSGAYIAQQRVANVKPGDVFKTGDILTYNPGFFVPDPLSKQVTFKHGVLANIALIEKSSNHEDACEISEDFSNRLKMTPCHQREIITKNDAVILDIVKLGQHVETADTLCIISNDYLIGDSLNVSMENLDIMAKLNRQTPSADYTGVITKIRILYGCDRNKLSDSLKKLLSVYEKEIRDNFKALNFDPTLKPPEKPGWVAPGTRYASIEFTEETVILEFMIEEILDMSGGDKLVISNQAKSIVSLVTEQQHYTESGKPLDMLFSTTSIVNRIIASPFINGIGERNMEALKQQAIDIYFK